ncbi:hypothetical protein [Aureivirga marina]|uniref:hypothetical protein n=1 Tax=Aureivirga marina TaxID=1182451 RepID=UPI0018C9B0B0|nr:hypothetical protein [Aureivirga marina]
MKEKLLKLRRRIPIPIVEAKKLLIEFDGDVEKIIKKFKREKINEIAQKTFFEINVIQQKYEENKYDFVKTLSFFENQNRLKNFDISKLKGFTEKSIEIIEKMEFIENEYDLASIFLFDELNEYKLILERNFELNELSKTIQIAQNKWKKIKCENMCMNVFKSTKEYKNFEKQFHLDAIKLDEKLHLFSQKMC